MNGSWQFNLDSIVENSVFKGLFILGDSIRKA